MSAPTLASLRAAWILRPGGGAVGVTFDCPHCPGAGVRLELWFTNPVGGGPRCVAPLAWHRLGEDLMDLTLTPTDGELLPDEHWAGRIVYGELRSLLTLEDAEGVPPSTPRVPVDWVFDEEHVTGVEGRGAARAFPAGGR